MDFFTTAYHASPYILLPLSAIGFILAIIADQWPAKRRFNTMVILCLVACAAVMGMGR